MTLLERHAYILSENSHRTRRHGQLANFSRFILYVLAALDTYLSNIHNPCRTSATVTPVSAGKRPAEENVT